MTCDDVGGPHLTRWRPYEQKLRFPEEKEFCLKTAAWVISLLTCPHIFGSKIGQQHQLLLELPAYWPALWILNMPALQFLKMSLERPWVSQILVLKVGCYCNKWLNMRKWLWDWVMIEARRILRFLIEVTLKRLRVEIWTWKAILVKTQKEGRRMLEKASIVLDNTCIVMNSMFLQIWMLKGLPVSLQKEMRSMILDIGGKVFLVAKWQKTWLNSRGPQRTSGHHFYIK